MSSVQSVTSVERTMGGSAQIYWEINCLVLQCVID